MAKIFVTPLTRVAFVGGGGGSQGTSPSLDLTFTPTGLSENLGGDGKGEGGKGDREGWGDHLPYSPPPTGFCLKYHPATNVCSYRLTYTNSDGHLGRVKLLNASLKRLF